MLHAEAMFQRIGDSILAGRFDSALSCFALPLPVFGPGGIATHLTQDEMLETAESTRRHLLGAGIVRIRGRVVAQSLPRNGQIRIVVEWTYLADGGTPMDSRNITYFCREIPQPPGTCAALEIEMVEYDRAVFEDDPDCRDNGGRAA